MKCSRCNVEMKIGKVLNCATEAGVLYLVPPSKGNAKTLGIKNCWKCPICGHSEFIEEK